MEADMLPVATRNHILCEVFDLLQEDDDEELPLRVLEEEAQAAANHSSNDSGKFEEFLNV
jgi:hypothetical protein